MYLVKPKNGKKVRDPKTYKHVPEKGLKIEKIDTFWFRRERDGDVEIVSLENPSLSGEEKIQE